jgi:hypothetical protein
MLSAMTYRRALAGVLVGLLVAACGGSSAPTSAGTSTTATSSTAATTATRPSTATATGPAAATTTATASRPPEVAGKKKAKPDHPSVSSNVTIPAAFLIGPDGRLTPATVSVPPGVSVSLGVENHDHAAHTVVLVAPKRPTLHVKAGAGTLTVVTGLANGTYTVLLDGTAAAKLTVGALGGP